MKDTVLEMNENWNRRNVVAVNIVQSRVVSQNNDERCFHIFYQLLQAATPEMVGKSARQVLNVPCNTYLS